MPLSAAGDSANLRAETAKHYGKRSPAEYGPLDRRTPTCRSLLERAIGAALDTNGSWLRNMPRRQPDKVKIWHSGWLLSGLALVLAGQARAANWSIDPTLEVGEAYTDNIELTSSGSDDFITEVTPGLSVSRVAPQFQAQARYQLQNLWYKDNSDFDDNYHDFSGVADAQFLNNALTVNATGNYDQQNIDPERAVGFSNLLQTGNRTDVARGSITPTYTTTLAPYVDSQLLYSYSLVHYVNTDDTTTNVEDSDRHFLRAIVGDLTDPGLIDWQTNYQYLSLIHISEPTRLRRKSRMPSSA